MFEEARTAFFPSELIPGVTAKSVSETIIEDVWRSLTEEVFSPLETLGNYSAPRERLEKAKALHDLHAQTHHENIVFYRHAQAVGWSSGVMLDASTFFMAYSGVLPAYQRQGIYGTFLRVFLRYLSALKYERVTSNHMVNNRAVLIAKLKANFVVTGVVLDERYGAQLALTHFLHTERRKGFERAFSLERYAM